MSLVFYNSSHFYDIFFFPNNYKQINTMMPNFGFWLDIDRIHGIS